MTGYSENNKQKLISLPFHKKKYKVFEENRTHLVCTIFTKVFAANKYRHKFPVIFKIYVLSSRCPWHKNKQLGKQIEDSIFLFVWKALPCFPSWPWWGPWPVVRSHCNGANTGRRGKKKTAFIQPERLWKTKCTYDALAPATAMLKPFCFGNLSLEKPFKDGLNFFKMSEEKKGHRTIYWWARATNQCSGKHQQHFQLSPTVLFRHRGEKWLCCCRKMIFFFH